MMCDSFFYVFDGVGVGACDQLGAREADTKPPLAPNQAKQNVVIQEDQHFCQLFHAGCHQSCLWAHANMLGVMVQDDKHHG